MNRSAQDYQLKTYFELENFFSQRKEIVMEDKKLPAYEAPEVITYTNEEIFEKLGPAHTGYVKGGDRPF